MRVWKKSRAKDFTPGPVADDIDSAKRSTYEIIAFFCLRASDDPGSPKSNSDYFWYTMTQAGGAPPTFFMETVRSSESHAFSLWGDYLNDHRTLNFTVRERVIAYFKQYLYN